MLPHFEKEAAQTIQGGIRVFERTYLRDTAEPSRCDVACLPPKSKGCFSEAAGQCTEIVKVI
ncbi:MAG: hypothetical protein ACFB15_22405 [Cyclobacteriaceae bacterium]